MKEETREVPPDQGGSPQNSKLTPQQTVAARLSQSAMLVGQGHKDRARQELETALAEARATPYEIEFLTRIQLAMMLSDSYLETGDLAAAGAMLQQEVAFASQIAEMMRAVGTLEQKRSANSGLLQLQDRCAQVELIGQEAPPISVLHWVQGETATLGEMTGRVVMLEFWATWCEPCREMFPRLRRFHQQYSDRGLEIIALTRFYMSLPGTPETQVQELELIRGTVTEHELEFRVGVMKDETVQAAYGATGLPTLVIVDRGGRVRWAGHSGDDRKVETLLEQYLAETV